MEAKVKKKKVAVICALGLWIIKKGPKMKG